MPQPQRTPKSHFAGLQNIERTLSSVRDFSSAQRILREWIGSLDNAKQNADGWLRYLEELNNLPQNFRDDYAKKAFNK